MRVCVRARACVRVCACVYACLCACVLVCACARVSVCACVYACACAFACIHVPGAHACTAWLCSVNGVTTHQSIRMLGNYAMQDTNVNI